MDTDALVVKEAVAQTASTIRTVYSQSAWFGRPDSEAQLPRQNRFVGRN